MYRSKRNTQRSNDSLHFSWSIFLIGILHCLVWSLGVGESYSRDFFSTQNISLKSGGTLSPSLSEEEVTQIALKAACELFREQAAAAEQQQLRLELEQRTQHNLKAACGITGAKFAITSTSIGFPNCHIQQAGQQEQETPAAATPKLIQFAAVY